MQLLDVTGIINWLVFIFSLFLIVLILQKDVSKRSNKAYILACLATGFWSLSLYFYNHPVFFDEGFWLNVAYTLTYLIILGHLCFAYFFPKVVEFPFKKVLALYVFLSVVGIVFLWFTDYVVESTINYSEKGTTVAEMGWGYYIYSIPLSIPFITTVILYIKKNRILKGYDKAQLKFYIFSVLIMGGGLFLVDVLLPILFGNTRLYGISPIFMIIYFVIIAYSILKHRFLGIKLILGNILQYALISFVAFIIFYGVIFSYKDIFGDVSSTSAMITSIFVIPIAVFIFMKFGEFIKRFVQEKVTYTSFDPKRTLNEFLKISSTELNMDKLITYLLSSLKKPLKLNGAGVVLFDLRDTKVIYKRASGIDITWGRDLLQVVHYWRDIKQDPILLLDELQRKEHPQIPIIRKRLEKIMRFMESNKISAILPLNRKVSLNGVAVLSFKEDEGVFTVEEVEFMENTIANASVALSRAILYQEVQNFNKTLQEKVDEQTKELSNKVTDLERAQQRERDMLDILGHELRTPLSIIQNALGLIEMKQNRGELNKELLSSYVDKGKESVKREIDIVENILRATKISSGNLTMKNEEVDMIDVIEDGIETQKKLANEKKLYIKFNKPTVAMPSGDADRTAVQQVMDNLLGNAVKYTEKGGVTISIDSDNEFVTVHLQDTGKGIPKDEVQNLGKKFYRLNQYLGSGEGKKLKMVRPGGTGIGLYVVFGLMKLMKGKIWADSEVGKGSTFHFSIPVYKGEKNADNKQQEADVFKRMGLKK